MSLHSKARDATNLNHLPALFAPAGQTEGRTRSAGQLVPAALARRRSRLLGHRHPRARAAAARRRLHEWATRGLWGWTRRLAARVACARDSRGRESARGGCRRGARGARAAPRADAAHRRSAREGQGAAGSVRAGARAGGGPGAGEAGLNERLEGAHAYLPLRERHSSCARGGPARERAIFELLYFAPGAWKLNKGPTMAASDPAPQTYGELPGFKCGPVPTL